MPIEPGQALSHYRLVEKVGEGGMGVVWKAQDTKLDRVVAIKILPPRLSAALEPRLRFQREARAAAALNHPNIAVIHEVDERDGIDFLVMEFIEGKTISERIGRGPLPPKEWLAVGLSIAEGLAHAHAHGVVHRDLKPHNVMLTGDQQVKLLDFGLAKQVETANSEGAPATDLRSRLETISQELTRAGLVVGTVAYMSPEQARGEPTDHRSDMFSTGIILFQMASGRLPFKGDSAVETLHSIIADEAQPLTHVASEFPPEADRIVRKAMEKEPKRRYQDAADLAADLRNLQRDVDSGAVSAPTGAVSRSSSGPLSRWAWIGMLGLAAILIAGGIYLGQWWRHRPEPAAPRSEGRALAVIGFENLSDPQDSEHLGRALMGLITTDLAESGGLKVVSTSKVLVALKRTGATEGAVFDASMAPEAARAAGAEVMLVGQVTQAGEHLLLAAELVDVESGNTLGSLKKEARSSSELFSLAGAIAAEVRSRIASDQALPRPFDLSRALTSSTEAYRHYAAGEIASHRHRWPEAIERFEQAIREDPTFALAYYRLAVAHWWHGSGTEGQDKVALQNGLQYIDRLPEHWQTVYRAFLDYVQEQFDASHEALTQLVESSPNIPDAYYFLGEIATHVSRYWDPRTARDCFEKTLAIDPTFRVGIEHLIEDYLLADDADAAGRLLARFRLENPDDAVLGGLEIQLLLVQARHDEAIARVEELPSGGTAPYYIWGPLFQAHLETGNWDRAYSVADEAARREVGYLRAFALGARAHSQIGRGRLREGLADLQEAAELMDTPLWESQYLLSRANVLAATGDSREAIQVARQAIHADPDFGGAYYGLGTMLVEAGMEQEAQETLGRLEVVAREVRSPIGEFYTRLLAAKLHLASGDVSKAAAELEGVAHFPPEYRVFRLEWLVRAHERAASGDPGGAITMYRKVLQPRYDPFWASFWITNSVVVRTRTLYAMARLEEQTGDLDSARSHYRELLARWGTADLPVPEVEDAKTRLARE